MIVSKVHSGLEFPTFRISSLLRQSSRELSARHSRFFARIRTLFFASGFDSDLPSSDIYKHKPWK
ncbi:hypothetical protein CH380_20415 [Leptospira adleri]|uniref:Uncharacterized protein n=1 Tax=Leptospira adleri TaxID=2023186 RepID=A0A2M9YIK1_9LEPT|nr:hypothetical protein CH380_20415 [Leptospira adleri]PJZ60429.1 hypothetical protein CH376_18420 [Leptospira adleri]